MGNDTASEAALRKSLDAIDNIRRTIFLAGCVAVALSLGAFVWLDHVARTSENLKSVLMAAVLALLCAIAWSTFALSLVITRMTKRILRAIDLASRTGPLTPTNR